MKTLEAVAAELAVRAHAESASAALEWAEALGRSIDLTEAALAALVRHVDACGAHQQSGYPSTVAWLRDRLGMRHARAAERVTLARQLPRLERTAKLLSTGDLSAAFATTICAAVPRLDEADALAAEDVLLEMVHNGCTVQQVAKAADRITDLIRERQGSVEEPQESRRGFTRSWLQRAKSLDGGSWLKGWLTPEHTAAFDAIVGPLAKPKAQGDDRDLAQRTADAMMSVLTEGNRGAGVTVIIDLAAYTAATNDPGPVTHTSPPPHTTNIGPPSSAGSATVPPAGPGSPAGANSAQSTVETSARVSSAAFRADMEQGGRSSPPDSTGSGTSVGPPSSAGSATVPPAGPASPSEANSAQSAAETSTTVSSAAFRADMEQGSRSSPIDTTESATSSTSAAGATCAATTSATNTDSGVGVDPIARISTHCPTDSTWRTAAHSQTPTSPMSGAGECTSDVRCRPEKRWTATAAARLLDGSPISSHDARRIALNAGINALILGRDGLPLYLGRTVRFVTPAQRKALLAIYESCAVRGCQIPAHLCEIHHLDGGWKLGTKTDIDKLIPACGWHNRWFEENPDRITQTRDTQGRVVLTITEPWARPKSNITT